ncbi:MAG: hypothetical protein ACTSP5_14025 [Candidatus Heimdallarchaeota archaeon]
MARKLNPKIVSLALLILSVLAVSGIAAKVAAPGGKVAAPGGFEPETGGTNGGG